MLRFPLQLFSVPVLQVIPLLLLQLTTNGQSANLDQGTNDKVATPRTPVSWTNLPAASNHSSGRTNATMKASATNSFNDPEAEEVQHVTLNVTVFPNPYRDKLILRFVAPVSGQVRLEVYNLLGKQIGQLNYGMVSEGTQHTIAYAVPVMHRNVLIYRLHVGQLLKAGKAIHARE